MSSPVVERWRGYARQGWLRLAYRASHRGFAHVPWPGGSEFRIHRVIATPPWRLRLPPRLGKGIVIRELTSEDVGQLASLRAATGMPYAERFAAYHRALGAFLNGRLVAFVWLRCGPAILASSFGVHWQLAAGMTWVYDLYSDPQVLGAVTHLYAELRRRPPGAACRLLVGQTDFDNVRSRLAHRSLGYESCATIWSWRFGRTWVHLSRSSHSPRWRWHASQARIPLHLLTRATGSIVAARGPESASGAASRIWLLCDCGRRSELSWRPAARYVCGCGRELGREQQGLAAVGPAMPYWGEIPQSEMQRLVAEAEQHGWRNAISEHLPVGLRGYVGDESRADFEELLPIAPGSRVLDVGAGWGSVAAPLARRHHVVALEGVPERARFTTLRGRQEGLAHLRVIQGDLHHTGLAPGQFDLIVANGILEWVPLLDLGARPGEVQLHFLDRLRELLAPGGGIYLAIENRVGWAVLRGLPDHSGLPYTSLMPRWMARMVCARSRRYRAQFNAGYRTYTYTLSGYRRLFAQVGLEARGAWFCPWGYNQPAKLAPFARGPLEFCFPEVPGSGPAAGLRRWARRLALHPALVRGLASDFAFWLEPVGQAQASVQPAAACVPEVVEERVANG